MKSFHSMALGLVAAASLASGCELIARYGLGLGTPPYTLLICSLNIASSPTRTSGVSATASR